MSKLVKQRIHSITELVDVLKTLPQLEGKVVNHFSDGVYSRELIMPKDMLAVGKIHTTRHLNIITKGSCIVVTPTRRLDVVAPFTFESLPGEQKVVYAKEETHWMTVHATEETNLEKLEELLITDEYSEELVLELVKGLGGQICLG